MKPFVFLDRDGTLIVQKPYLGDPDAVEVIEGVGPALRRLHDAGFGLAVITNQSGISRGYFGPERVDAIHRRMCELLAGDGAVIDAIYVCPHLPEEGCSCRKPGAALIDAAVADHKIDREASFIIGDKGSDIECGINAGLMTVLVRTGYGSSLPPDVSARADFVADGLPDAVDWILETRHPGAQRVRRSTR